jgi:hypothetical protein
MGSPLTTAGKGTIWQSLRSAVIHAVGGMLERVHAPARIREFEYISPDTNEMICLSTGARYSVLHVGAKRLFFDRVTGQFDGTGELLEERVADGLELLN